MKNVVKQLEENIKKGWPKKALMYAIAANDICLEEMLLYGNGSLLVWFGENVGAEKLEEKSVLLLKNAVFSGRIEATKWILETFEYNMSTLYMLSKMEGSKILAANLVYSENIKECFKMVTDAYTKTMCEESREYRGKQ